MFFCHNNLFLSQYSDKFPFKDWWSSVESCSTPTSSDTLPRSSIGKLSTWNTTICDFFLSFFDNHLLFSLVCLHYLALLLLELRHQGQPQFYIKVATSFHILYIMRIILGEDRAFTFQVRNHFEKHKQQVVRSPDGESRGLPLGKLSIQRAAAMVIIIFHYHHHSHHHYHYHYHYTTGSCHGDHYLPLSSSTASSSSSSSCHGDHYLPLSSSTASSSSTIIALLSIVINSYVIDIICYHT